MVGYSADWRKAELGKDPPLVSLPRLVTGWGQNVGGFYPSVMGQQPSSPMVDHTPSPAPLAELRVFHTPGLGLPGPQPNPTMNLTLSSTDHNLHQVENRPLFDILPRKVLIKSGHNNFLALTYVLKKILRVKNVLLHM